MVGFALLPLGVVGPWVALASRRGQGVVVAALVASVVGAGGVLPCYGAEDFALHALGRGSARGGLPVEGIVEAVRFGPGAWVFGVGLVALAACGVLVAVAAARTPGAVRWGGVLLGLGLVLHLPRFYGPPGLRTSHGVLVGAGGVLLGAGLLATGRGRGC